MRIALLTDYLHLVEQIVTILGFPIAIYLYFQEKAKERREREYGTYNALDDKYIHFLHLCLAHPELDVFDLPLEGRRELTPAQRKQEQILFTILISILERAYLMYKDQSTEVKTRQWAGWVAYMEDYGARENFRREWRTLGKEFDSDFVEFMDEIIQSAATLKVDVSPE